MNKEAKINLIVEFGTSTINDIVDMLGDPRKFHENRLKNPEQYFDHGLRLWGIIAFLLSTISYFIVSSVTNIKHPSIFLAGSTLFNFIHGLFIALLFVGIAKFLQSKGNAKINIAAVLYSYSIMPIISFLMIPLEQARVTSMVNDSTLFLYGYIASFNIILEKSVLIQGVNILDFFLYLYFCYLVYVGIKVVNHLNWKRAFLISFVGFIILNSAIMNMYLNIIMLPIGQMFIKAVSN